MPYPLFFLDYECRPNEFRCRSDGLCVDREHLCDDIRHCSDGEDELEENCPEGNAITVRLVSRFSLFGVFI